MDDLSVPFLVATAALFGAAIGSFLNVCIYRLPRRGLSVGRPVRSFCPTCGDAISARDNIPFVSWWLLGGRCRSCRTPIAVRYFIVEALTAALFAVVAYRFSASLLDGDGSWGGLIVWLLVIAALIVASFVDMDLRILPDEITIVGMHILPIAIFAFPDIVLHGVEPSVASVLTQWSLGLEGWAAALPEVVRGGWGYAAVTTFAAALAFLVGGVSYRAYRARRLPDLPNRWRDVSLAATLSAISVGLAVAIVLDPSVVFEARVHATAGCLLGMVVGSSLVFLVGVIGSRVFRKPAMGFGDVKLMGLLGALAGWKGVVFGFFIACFLGSIFGIVRLALYRDRYLPFGPFLTMGCLLVALWPEAIVRAVEAYLALFQ